MRLAYCDNHPEKEAIISIKFTTGMIGSYELLGHTFSNTLGITSHRDLCEDCAKLLGFIKDKDA